VSLRFRKFALFAVALPALRNSTPAVRTAVRVVLVVLFLCVDRLSAAEFTEEFDAETPSWQIVIPQRSDVELVSRRRSTELKKSGSASELIEVTCRRDGLLLELHHELPPSVPLDDLFLTLAVRSNLGSVNLAVRAVFPNQVDPRTGQIMTALLPGRPYTKQGQWEQLTVKPNQALVSRRGKLLRAELRSVPLDLTGAYIDRVVVLAKLPRGNSGFLLDELRWTGYVAPQKNITPVSTDSDYELPGIEMTLDRLLIEGHPVVLRYTPHHGEDLSRMATLGLNAVWIDDYRDTAKLRELRSLSLWALATPPRGVASEPGPSGEISLSLEPFGESTDGIIAWNISTRAPSSALPAVESQVRLVRAADQERNRPVFGDIGGAERGYSRILDAVGLSRHPLQTEFEIHDYRKFLSRKSQKLRPGTFVTTWIQTEIDPDDYPMGPAGTVPIVEPEQIRLLTFAAICSGCKGIGFWKRTAFDADIPGARERELAIAIVNQEISLLEPWIATHSVIEYQPVPIQATPLSAASRDVGQNLTIRSRARKLREDSRQMMQQRAAAVGPAASSGNDRIEMAMISGPNGQLLIPLWYQKHAQFVPGQMATSQLEITIPGIQDTATIWEVSTTQVRSLPKRRGPGGTRVVLENFDQLAALVISTDRNWGRILRRQIGQIQQRSASLWLALAQEKLERVKQTDQDLRQLGFGIPDSDRILQQAEAQLNLARREARLQSPEATDVLTVGYTDRSVNHNSVRLRCSATLRALRILQRAHWTNATDGQVSPLSSPWTASFHSLPDHWRFFRRMTQQAAGAGHPEPVINRLPSGNFEATDTERMVSDGWKHSQGDLPGIQASADLVSLRGDSGTSLRLVAVPGPNQEIPVSLSGTPISVRTPPIPVRAGEVVSLEGFVRVPVTPAGSLEGVTVYENLTGTRLHWTRTEGWQEFHIQRDVAADTEFTVQLTLHGLGEARFDNLRILVGMPAERAQNPPIRNQTTALPGLLQPDQPHPGSQIRGLDFLMKSRKIQ